MNLVYLIGEPGVGKSTLLAELVKGLPWMQVPKPIPHIWYGDGAAVEIGMRREGFSGTDALSMGIQPLAVEWIQSHPAWLVLGEGDRLANDGFFRAAKGAGYDLWLILLRVTPEVAAARRQERGSAQNPTWLRGRVTKVNRLAQRWYHVTLDGSQQPHELAERLRMIVPALDQLAPSLEE